MHTTPKTSRLLGFAFLFQFITSFTSGAFLRPMWFAEGDMAQSLLNLAQKPWVMQAAILLDMLTALGVIFLGAILFATVRKQNEKLALTALGFYILEGALLATSRSDAISLLHISQEFSLTGNPVLLSLGNLAYEAMDYAGNTLHMLAFCLGAIPFYFLLYKSGAVPRWMALWGLLALFPMLIGTVTQILGYSIPIAFYFPYVPFEFVIGIWIAIQGARYESETPEALHARRADI